MDQNDFINFKNEYQSRKREAVLKLAYDWYVQAHLINTALESLKEQNLNLTAINDSLVKIIKDTGNSDKITPKSLKTYANRRKSQYSVGIGVAANGIDRHADLRIRDARTAVAKKGGEGTSLVNNKAKEKIQIRKIFSSGQYKTKKECAEAEHKRLGISCDTAVDFLKEPKPKPKEPKP